MQAGQSNVKLLIAFAEVSEDEIPELEQVLGGPVQEAQMAWQTIDATPVEEQFMAVQRVGLARQLVGLFVNSKVRCLVHGGTDEEAWKGESKGGLELSEAEQQLYDVCLRTLREYLAEGLENGA